MVSEKSHHSVRSLSLHAGLLHCVFPIVWQHGSQLQLERNRVPRTDDAECESCGDSSSASKTSYIYWESLMPTLAQPSPALGMKGTEQINKGLLEPKGLQGFPFSCSHRGKASPSSWERGLCARTIERLHREQRSSAHQELGTAGSHASNRMFRNHLKWMGARGAWRERTSYCDTSSVSTECKHAGTARVTRISKESRAYTSPMAQHGAVITRENCLSNLSQPHGFGESGSRPRHCSCHFSLLPF